MKKAVLLFLLLLVCTSVIFSQSTSFMDLSLEDQMEIISQEVESESSALIERISEFDKAEPNYEYLINFIVEKAGDLVFQEQYDYAFKMIEGILFNNLSHVQAQELYLILDEILKERAEEERILREAEAAAERERIAAAEEAERLRLEEEAEVERLRLAEEERIRLEEEEEARLQEEEAQRLAEQEAREVEHQAELEEKQKIIEETAAREAEIRQVSPDNFSFYARLFPLDFTYFTSEVNTEYNYGTAQENILYGLGLQLRGEFNHPFVFAHLDVEFDSGFLQISDYDGKNIEINTAMAVGTPLIFIPLNLRVGFIYNTYLYQDADLTDMTITTLPSLLLGMGFGSLELFDRLKIDLSFDYYMISVFVENITAAFASDISLALKVMEFETFALDTVLSANALFVLQSGLFETNFKGKIGIGISYND